MPSTVNNQKTGQNVLNNGFQTLDKRQIRPTVIKEKKLEKKKKGKENRWDYLDNCPRFAEAVGICGAA